MGSPEKFKSAMKNRPVEITKKDVLPAGFTDNTGLALPKYFIYFMTDGLMLPHSAFDYGDTSAIYTVIHELGHVWDIRSNMSLSINMALHLGNTQFPNSLFACLTGPADPTIRFACAMSNWRYDGVNNEPAPGDPARPYASYSIAEDWAEAVAYTTYGEEYGKIHPSFNKIGPIRKIYVEMMMRDLH